MLLCTDCHRHARSCVDGGNCHIAFLPLWSLKIPAKDDANGYCVACTSMIGLEPMLWHMFVTSQLPSAGVDSMAELTRSPSRLPLLSALAYHSHKTQLHKIVCCTVASTIQVLYGRLAPIVPRYSTSVAVKPAGSPVFRPESLPCSWSPGLASLFALGVRPKRPAARKMVVDATTICTNDQHQLQDFSATACWCRHLGAKLS